MKNLAILIALFAIFPAAEARELSEIRKGGTLIVSTNGTFSPFSIFRDNKLSGFEIDLIEGLAQLLGVKVDWKVVPFESTLVGLSQGRYDLVIASHGITEERQKAVSFTDPYYCTGALILSRQGGPKNVAELKGKPVGTQVGTTYLTFLKTVPGVGEIKTYKSETDTLMALIGGRIAAMVGDKFASLNTAKARPEAKLQAGEMIFQEKIAMAVGKNNESLKKAINEALKTMQTNGSYQKISKKYFGEDIRCH